MRNGFSLALAVAYIPASSAQAATGVTSEAAATCGPVLAPTEINSQNSLAMRYAYSKLLSEQNSKAVATSLDATIPVIDIGVAGTGDYNQLSSKLEQIGLKWSVDQSSSYIARFIPANQTEAYARCVEQIQTRADATAAIAFNDVINGTANFAIAVKPTNGINIKRRLVVWTNGVPQGSWVKDFEGEPGNVNIGIKWPDMNVPLVVRVQMFQVEGGPIGEASKFILWPDIQEEPFERDSDYIKARYPNRAAPGRYFSASPASVDAASDEVLIPSSVRVKDYTHLSPTWGAKTYLTCNNWGFDWDSSNDSGRVSARLYCDFGYADENPGVRARFSVKGYRISLPVRDGSAQMTEQMYD